MTIKMIGDKYWLFPDGNKYSKIIFSYEEAKFYYLTLVNCSNCTNCIRCVECDWCKNCSDCKKCSQCDNIDRYYDHHCVRLRK